MERLTDIVCWTLFKGFKLYESFARVFIRIAFPIAKYTVDKALEGFGWNTEGKGPLGIHVHDEKEFYLRLAIAKNFGLFEGTISKTNIHNLSILTIFQFYYSAYGQSLHNE
jgi:hypothetical protein